MTIRAVKPGGTWWFTPESERDEPEASRTMFELRFLTVRERADIENGIGYMVASEKTEKRGSGRGDFDKFVPTVGDTEIETLVRGLVGWKNFRDADDGDVEFTTRKGPGGNQVPTEDTLSHIPPGIRRELSNAITRGTELDEEDEGN